MADKELIYSRINLTLHSYCELDNWKYLSNPDIGALNEIYYAYCSHKKFISFMPIFDSQYTDKNTDIVGYYDNNILCAFSMIKIHDSTNAEALQFAWDYKNPKLRLGINSLNNECEIYKRRGFTYLYLGQADSYKRQIKGFEILGAL